MPNHTLSHPTAEIVLPATVLLPQKCPACDAETFAPAGSLCERCYPDDGPLAHEEGPS